MLPVDGKFSSAPAPASYYVPDNLSGYTRQVDYERGGIALHDASRGLMYQNWKAAYDRTAREVTLSNESGFSQVMFSAVGLTQLALAFNLAMNPYFAYTQRGVTWLHWRNANNEDVKMVIPSATQPRLSLDDKRPENAANADVLLFYLKGSQICMRVQREGFLTEHIMANDVLGTRLGRVGMTTGMRLQVELLP